MKALKQFATGKLDPKSKKDWKLDDTKEEDKKTNTKEKGQYAKTKENNS